jgi:hypothetical protein
MRANVSQEYIRTSLSFRKENPQVRRDSVSLLFHYCTADSDTNFNGLHMNSG